MFPERKSLVQLSSAVLLTLTLGCSKDLKPSSTPELQLLPTYTPVTTEAPKPTSTPTIIFTPTPIDLSVCQPDDQKEESDIYVAPQEGIRKRSLPQEDSPYDGAVPQNIKLTSECAREVNGLVWFRGNDGREVFWVRADYTSKEPIPTPTPRRVSIPSPEPILVPEIFAQLEPEKSARVAELINQERTKRGLATLSSNEQLRKAAEKYISYLHDSVWLDNPGADPEALRGSPIPEPHTRKGTPQSRAAEEGYKGIATEVLGFNLITNPRALQNPLTWQIIIRDRVNGWLTSPGHRDTILGNWQEIGVGCIWEANWYRPFFDKPLQMFLCVAMVGNPSR